MMNKSEAEEQIYLEEIKQKLSAVYERLDRRVHRLADEIREQKTYMWEQRADMDHVEKVSARQSAQQTVMSGEVVLADKMRVQKLLGTPYFGRFDFLKAEESEAFPVYVGIHSFIDEITGKLLIYDWRAPISTMFYDFELGEARYKSPSGFVFGDILLKRQYRIRNGKMAFMLESGLNIMDDVLQEELSRTSDERMKNIVATIQRDQNAIIRNEDAKVLIIQGAAGSGKTSIALHRVAFLLYRYKESLRAKDILIISPNKVFSDFISNVLPELGEEQIAEKGMESLAGELLEDKFKFQTFFEQTSQILEMHDYALARRVEVKASLDFLKQLDEYIVYIENTCFVATDLTINGRLVPAWIIEAAFNKREGRPVSERLKWTAELVEREILSEYQYEITAKERAFLKASLKKMHAGKSLRALYKELFSRLGEPSLFKSAKNGAFEYCDVFPLIYLKLRLEGTPDDYNAIKHLVIDEMQDYTPVQYAVISRLFSCDKTILGDSAQSISPFCASNFATIERVFVEAESVKLLKSYRSSYEIVDFTRRISPEVEIIPIERHGEPPRVLSCGDRTEEVRHIKAAIGAFYDNDARTMGILVKTQRQADELYESIREDLPQLHLLTEKSTAFIQGAVVAAAHLAKGLEFDHVLVPNVSEENYSTEMDRNLLYIACTRAMHRLTLTYSGVMSRWVPQS